jgi:hypothetical protein
VSRSSSTSVYTSEFRHEFEADTMSLLARRLERFCRVWGVVGLVVFAVRGLAALLREKGLDLSVARGEADWTAAQWILVTLADTLVVTMYLVTGLTLRRWKLSQRTLAEVPGILILIEALVRLLTWTQVQSTEPLLHTTLSHMAACLFLPWNLWRAVRPMIPVIFLAAAFKLLGAPKLDLPITLAIALSPLTVIPGAAIAWLKHSRRMDQFKMSILSRRYGEFKRELLDAQKVHESMFPRAITSGPITFWYEYEPMRGIGGDFVFTSAPNAKGAVTIVVVDVTGHGIAAALTVNRLYGELERVLGENPDVSPPEVLKLLNRYIHLTLAKHSVYATAVVMRVDPAKDLLEYASGGHPPAFIRAVDGTIHELDSTAFVLGVCGHEDFDSECRSLRFAPGDAVIAYTDGASEARDERGRMLGTAGMRSILAGTPVHISQLARRSLSGRGMDDLCGTWCRTVLSAVEAYRHGPPDDDTLVVEITRPLGSARAS